MIRLTLTILFMFFLPGYTLINAVYPARGELDEDLDILYRLGFSIGSSAAIFVLVGFVLGNIPTTNGLFIERNLWASLVFLTLVFFLVGWYRGGYQSLALISPRLSRAEPKVSPKKDEGREKVKKLQKLARKRGALKERIRSSEGKEKKELKEQLEKVEEKLKEAEKEREEDL